MGEPLLGELLVGELIVWGVGCEKRGVRGAKNAGVARDKAPHMIIAFFKGEKINTYFKYLWALPLGSLIVIKYLRDTYGR